MGRTEQENRKRKASVKSCQSLDTWFSKVPHQEPSDTDNDSAVCDDSRLSRVVTRYVGLGIKGVGSGIKALGSGIRDHGIGISSFFRDQRPGCTVFAGSGKISHAFGIKDQKFAYNNWINIEKHTSLSPLAETTTSDLSQLLQFYSEI